MGDQAYEGFQPQWHHVFPREYLRPLTVPEDQIDALANMAVIGQGINIRISKRSPMDYIQRYGISADLLNQQFIGPNVTTAAEHKRWLEVRAKTLATAANAYLASLTKH
jgi:hypothetical protein